jgi:type 1 glutamine amidotransferase
MKQGIAILFRRAVLAAAFSFGLSLSAAPKHVLVVTATQGFRHSSIPLAEKVLAGLGEQTGIFTVDYARGGADGKGSDDLAEKMTRDALKKYDAIIFANTTGDLPLPQKEALTDFVKSGKAFVGMHSASDTFHGWRPYIDMLGGEFQTHNEQVHIDCINEDQEHPATRHLGPFFGVFDEIYIIKSYDGSKVHRLLTLDKHPNTGIPGEYPVSWCKEFGKGRVFYTSLGHREDVWLSQAYQEHVLGGIKWALGLEKGAADPQRTEVHLTKEEKREGFKPLFNGKNIEGWHLRHKDGKQSWSVQNGVLCNVLAKDEHGTDLVSDDKFQDFIVRYEYMVPKGANSGFYLRGRHEIQIFDDIGNNLKEPGLHSNGAIYIIEPATTMVSRKAGDWQTVEAKMIGDKVTVFLNGVKIHDNLVVNKPTGSELDDKVGEPGPFLLQGDHGSVAFRNIRVKKL